MSPSCVWMIFSMALSSVPGKITLKKVHQLHVMSQAICFNAKKRSLDPVLVLSIAKHESNFTRQLISRTHDYGLMQIHSKSKISSTAFTSRIHCNLLKTRCNIRWGTYIMSVWRRACRKHLHLKPKCFHWIRHYNWYGGKGKYYLRVLWLTVAYKAAWNGRIELYYLIKHRRYPNKL